MASFTIQQVREPLGCQCGACPCMVPRVGLGNRLCASCAVDDHGPAMAKCPACQRTVDVQIAPQGHAEYVDHASATGVGRFIFPCPLSLAPVEPAQARRW